ncbi:hybrid sensor histidine kinase/response regulator [[Phormidium] sp. ETS-05]|uniref:hybrid sensor histidine kinase/response regulator n=1 Tax=[Phormidium] sp. ETS-05 TaxID=222819 RepID=UPI001E6262E2|nr:hybrid sensor histidine kinase/response regulator [[Phormidium] sp. ETS-05]
MSSNGDLSNFDMMELFRIEVETQAAILNNGLVEIEGHPEASMEIESLMRAAHSIKGAARIVALDAAVKIAHALEDCFVAAQSGQIILESQVIDVLFTGVDLLKRLAQIKGKEMENWLRECHNEIETTIQGIAGILHPETSLPSPPAVAPTSLPVTPVTLLPYELQDNIGLTIRELFAVEVETQAGVIQNTLIGLKNTPNKPANTGELESLKIAAHAIKGAALLVDILPAVELATTLEDCFQAAKDQPSFSSEHIESFLEALEWLLELARADEITAREKLDNHIAGEIIGKIKNIWEQLSEIANNVGVEKGYLEEKTLPIDLPGGLQIVANGGAPQSKPNTSPPSSSSSFAQPPLGRGERSPTEGKDDKIQRGSGLQPAYSSQLGGPMGVQTPQHGTVRSGKLSTQATGAIQELTSSGGGSADRVVRVSADNLNRLMGLAGESLVEAKWLQPFADSLLKLKKQNLELSNLLEKVRESLAGGYSGDGHPGEGVVASINAARLLCNQSRELLGDRLQALEQFALSSANLSDRLYREVIATHMRPFADGVQGFPRLVRDLARELGKQVKLEITGHSTLVDRDILEKLEAPLNHLLRNAVDHGIEYPPERLTAGKPTTGTVLLEATHRAGMLLITVSDDGKGVEIEQLRQKIIQKNLVSPEMAHHLSEAELMEFLFLPGFSTATKVTEISGRGVGLDVVHSTLAQVGGILRATSRPGKGMSFHMQLPLTLSVMRTLQVEISGEPYAFPLSRIDRILMVDPADIFVAENRQYFTFDDRNIGLVAASQVLELPPTPVNSPQLPVVVISDRSATYGVVVDRFLGERDLVVRPLDPRLGKLQDISAAALMESGLPLLIIDVEDMVRSIDKVLSGGRLRKVSEPEPAHLTKSRKRVLIVDDSITVREVERKLLENNGYEVEVAVNGMDGWNAVRTNQYDLVITDVDMPRMNGIELVSQIKNHPHLKVIPVMIVSYKDRDEDRIRGLEAGADYYLTKSSFHDETLLHAVIDLIGS